MKSRNLSQNDIEWILSDENDFENQTFEFDRFELVDEYLEEDLSNSKIDRFQSNLVNAKESAIQYFTDIPSLIDKIL